MNRNESLKSNKLGAYFPHFFYFSYDSDKPLIKIMNSTDEFIILHEFIHFLQDISTLYGSMNFCNIYNTLRYAVNQIYACNSNTVKLPIDISQNNYIKKSIIASKITLGDTADMQYRDRKFYLKKENCKIDDVISFDFYYFEVENNRYRIGARDVLENMAFIIEREIYGNKKNLPYFPYNTIEFLIKIIYPELYNNKVIISGLCELSLLSSNPGTFIIDSLLIIKEKRIQVITLDDLLNLFSNNLAFKTTQGDIITDYNTLIKYALNNTLDFAIEPFRSSDLAEVKKWITIVINKALAYRINDPFFITKGLFDKNPRLFYLDKLVKDIGCPTIMNNKSEPYTLNHAHNTSQVIFFNAIKEIMKIILFGINTCGLIVGCKEEVKYNPNAHKVTNDCYNKPWNKVKDKRLCPVAILWKLWRLDKKKYNL